MHTIYLLTDTYLISFTFIEQQFFGILCELGYDGEIRIHFSDFELMSLLWKIVFRSLNIFKMKGNRLSKIAELHHFCQKIRTIIFLTLSKMSVVLDQHIYFQSVDYFKWTFNKKLTWSGAAPLIHSDVYLVYLIHSWIYKH